MLYISDKDNKTIKEWQVGQWTQWISGIDISQIHLVQADGDELEHLRATFEGIPFSKVARVQTWYGDMAKFIAGNLE